MSSYNRMVEKLERLLEYEHVDGCNDSTCDINATYTHGATLWALHLYHNCGGASEAFDAVYVKLIAQYGKRFDAAAERERAAFVREVDSITCSECSAITWVPGGYTVQDFIGLRCDSCAALLKDEV